MPPEAKTAKVRQQPVRLTKEEKDRVIEVAWELQHTGTYRNMTTLLKAAVDYLDEDRRPSINSTTDDRWKWFVDAMTGERPKPTATAPSPMAPDRMPDLDPEPEESDDERAEWAMIVAYRLERERARSIDARVNELGEGLAILTEAIREMQDQLRGMPESFRSSTADLISKLAMRDAATRPELNGHAPAVTPAVSVIKPRVMVIGYTSGAQISGVTKEVAGRAHLQFAKADPAFPKYSDVDFIVVTKEAPLPWTAEAKDKYPAAKLVIATGNASKVGQTIASLRLPKK